MEVFTFDLDFNLKSHWYTKLQQWFFKKSTIVDHVKELCASKIKDKNLGEYYTIWDDYKTSSIGALIIQERHTLVYAQKTANYTYFLFVLDMEKQKNIQELLISVIAIVNDKIGDRFQTIINELDSLMHPKLKMKNLSTNILRIYTTNSLNEIDGVNSQIKTEIFRTNKLDKADIIAFWVGIVIILIGGALSCFGLYPYSEYGTKLLFTPILSTLIIISKYILNTEGYTIKVNSAQNYNQQSIPPVDINYNVPQEETL